MSLGEQMPTSEKVLQSFKMSGTTPLITQKHIPQDLNHQQQAVRTSNITRYYLVKSKPKMTNVNFCNMSLVI